MFEILDCITLPCESSVLVCLYFATNVWRIKDIHYYIEKKNCSQSIQCCISRRSKTAKIKCYKL